MKKQRIITIVGNVASGKTTSLPLITQALDADVIQADELFQTSPFRDDYLADMKRWAFTNELWLVHKRGDLIARKLRQSEKSNIIIDSGLFMSWAYTKGHDLTRHMQQQEWDFFQEMFDHLAKPTLEQTTILCLTCPIETLLLRIKDRARDYEIAFYTKDYLELIEQGLQVLCKKFASLVNDIIYLSAEETGNIVDSEKDKKHFQKLIVKKLT